MSSIVAASSLVRLLHNWAPADLPASGGDVAERLAAALGPLQAIALHGLHQSLAAHESELATAPGDGAAQALAGTLAQDLQRARGALAHAIAQDPLAIAYLQPGDKDFGYAPYRQRHTELQRQMEQMIGALRDHVRQAVGRHCARLRALVALDTTFDELLALREQALLPTTASWLERRFHQLRAAHRQALQAAGHDDDPAAWMAPGQWLATFTHDWRQALLAELELRLEPVLGLIEALRNDTDTHLHE